MKKMQKGLATTCVFFSLVFLVCSIFTISSSSFASTGKTLDNLQAAYDGESNANAKYLAFAAKADEEGYGEVASLFRAAAKAEQIHMASHAKVIQEMGAVPIAKIKEAQVLTTKENLQAAIEGETYEKTMMYPEFISAADQRQL
nr:rubrerythrin family protein [Desulfosediminicola flagellatus]